MVGDGVYPWQKSLTATGLDWGRASLRFKIVESPLCFAGMTGVGA
jgi:hypothetical protein